MCEGTKSTFSKTPFLITVFASLWLVSPAMLLTPSSEAIVPYCLACSTQSSPRMQEKVALVCGSQSTSSVRIPWRPQ